MIDLRIIDQHHIPFPDSWSLAMKMFYFEGGICQHSARLYERKDVPCDELDVFQVYMNDEAGT